MSTTLLEAPIKSVEEFDEYEIDSELEENYCPKGFEFADGQLKELNVSSLSSYVAGRFFTKLTLHSDSKRAGWVSPEGTSFLCFPEEILKVRRADTAFHLLNRLTAEQARVQGYCKVVPDIVVEVVSTHDSANEVNAKRIEWLRAGVQLLWIVYPLQREVHVYSAQGSTVYLTAKDTLTGEPVLTDFAVHVSELFTLPDEVAARATDSVVIAQNAAP